MKTEEFRARIADMTEDDLITFRAWTADLLDERERGALDEVLARKRALAATTERTN